MIVVFWHHVTPFLIVLQATCNGVIWFPLLPSPLGPGPLWHQVSAIHVFDRTSQLSHRIQQRLSVREHTVPRAITDGTVGLVLQLFSREPAAGSVGGRSIGG